MCKMLYFVCILFCVHLINHGLGVTIGFMCIWSGEESPLVIISLRGTCDQRKADINWRTVLEWGVKWMLLACKRWW